MSMRHLYLARHAEPSEDGGLTAKGVQQAELLGQRLSRVPFASVHHGPLPRATATAELVARHLDPAVPLVALEAAGDYVPHVPRPEEVDPEHREGVMTFLAEVTPKEADHGVRLGAEVTRLLTGPVPTPHESHHLVVTHAFTIGWLVRQAYSAPPWRWVGLDSCHGALTVIRYADRRPPTVAMFNDMSHLSEELRWTGFLDPFRI